MKTALASLLLVAEIAVALGLAIVLVWFWKFSRELPNFDNLSSNFGAPVATTIVSEDGVVLGKIDVENREPVQLDVLPKYVIDATVSIEDHRFWEHHGIDFWGIGRAIVLDLRRGNMTSQGASTLTQQLARNVPSFGLSREKKYSRKMQEALIALRLEQTYTKREILELYLNDIYYGSHSHGIQAAAETYFGKPAKDLTLGEAALLAGVPQRPSAFNPYWQRSAALARRNAVLDAMLEYNYISDRQCEEAKAENPKILRPRLKKPLEDNKAPYFFTYVRHELNELYGADMVNSGLRVETTLNWKIQQMAEKTLEDALKNGSAANQGALVAIDPNTGYIRALVGGRDFHASQFNNVTQGHRQPGSTFKVFDYAAAFDTGACDLDSTFKDEPFPYPHDPEGRVVKNYGGRCSYRYKTCLEAIRDSTNTVAVRVAQKTGINTVIKYARNMGISSTLDAYLPTALGASDVYPLDLCSAYTVFPMKGSRNLPMAIVRVTDADGNVVDEQSPQLKTGILKPQTVKQMETALEAVVTSGTGMRARGDERSGIVENAHGKTGTTSNNRDAWFAGYTPELATVIWVARVHTGRSGRSIYEQMEGTTGGVVCAPIWHDFMIQAVPEQRKFHLVEQVAADAPKKEQDGAQADDQHKAAARRARARAAAAAADNLQHPEEPGNDADTDGAAATQPDAATEGGNQNDGAQTAEPPATTDIAAGNGDTAGGERAAAAGITGGPGRTRIGAPTDETPAAVVRAPAMVTVQVCVDSGQLATEWCPATRSERVTASRARRMRRCRTHHPPPGEQ